MSFLCLHETPSECSTQIPDATCVYTEKQYSAVWKIMPDLGVKLLIMFEYILSSTKIY